MRTMEILNMQVLRNITNISGKGTKLTEKAEKKPFTRAQNKIKLSPLK